MKLNGEELPVKAVAFDGTSYVPLRALGDALDMDVDFIDFEVILNDKVKEGDSIDIQISKIEDALRVNEKNIEIAEGRIARAEQSLERRKEYVETELIPVAEAELAERRDELEKLLEEKTKLESQLAEIQP